MNDLQTIPKPDTTDIDTAEDTRLSLSDLIRYRYKHNMSYQQIADKLGCNKSSVMRKLTKYISLLPDAENVKAWEENKSKFLSALEVKVYDKMCNEETLKDASFNNLAYGFQNICTQNRLEQGLATERIDSFSVTASLSELARRKQELMDKVMGNIQPVVLDTISTPSIIPDKQDK